MSTPIAQASGLTFNYFVAAENLDANHIVTSTGYKVDATDADHVDIILGLSLASVNVGNQGIAVTRGMYVVSAWTGLFSNGAPLYIDPTTPGEVTDVEPTGVGEYIIQIGYMLDNASGLIEVAPIISLNGSTEAAAEKEYTVSAQTNSDTPAALWESSTVGESEDWHVEVKVMMSKADLSEGDTWHIVQQYNRAVGETIKEVTDQFFLVDSAGTSCDCYFDYDTGTNKIQLMIVGQNANTHNWVGIVRVLKKVT